MTHLTERTHTLLLQGSLPPEDSRALARHLEGPCAVCEELLASLPSADAVDGLVETSLGALATAGGRGHDLEFARIEAALRQRGAAAPSAPRRFLPAALAAALLAAGVAGLVLPRVAPDRGGWDGLKGAPARPVPARLRFVVVAPAPGGPPAVAQGVSGQPVSREASLQFEIEAGRAGHAALVRVPAQGAAEAVWADAVAAGRTLVTLDGRPAAYPLAEVSGAQRFVLVASGERLDLARAAAAAAALAPPAPAAPDLPSAEGLTFDWVQVEVR